MHAPVISSDLSDLRQLDVSRPELYRSQTHWPLFERLRREDPVHYCPASAYGPYWSITRYDDIVTVEKDHERFSSNGNIIINDVGPEFDAPAFATADPPVHTRERRAVQPALAPKRIAALAETVRRHVGEVLDDLPRDRAFDWVERVAAELTTQMMALLFDYPWSERYRIARWCEALVTTPMPGAIVTTWDERAAMVDEYRDYVIDLWRRRASGPRGDDVISLLAHHPDTAAMLDDPAHLLGTVTLIAGANEAARGGLSGSVVAFDRFPAELAKLRENPALASQAAAEIVRWQTPITHMRRTATEDVELGGKRIRKGDKVVLWYCSGNRDESQFPDGDALDIERPNARRHLAFGVGIHRCLGSHAAELQLTILWEEIVKRFERIELAGEPRYKASNFSAGHEELPVRIVA